MDTAQYFFTNSAGDDYALEISRIKKGFLSDETYQMLSERGIEVWDIILIRQGWKLRKTPLSVLSDISRCIADFFLTHQHAMLYFQCDDLEDVPMSNAKRAEGLSVQAYRSRLFSRMFDRQVKSIVGLPVVNVPIYFEACGNGVYLHVMTQEQFIPYIEVIRQDVTECYSK
jgi:hypothetical protein